MTSIVPAGNGVPSATDLADPAHAKAWKAAVDFEAMALGQFLQPMFNTVDTAGGFFGGGAGEAQWKPMMIDEIAHNISRGGGLGLAGPVYQQILRTQEEQAEQAEQAAQASPSKQKAEQP